MNIVLFGVNGQVGKELCRILLPHGRLIPIARDQVDLTDGEAIRQCLLSYKPEIIVNAAAYTAVDRAESEPELADAVNHIAPKMMAECAQELGSLLIHYSTDYVFEGTGTTAYAPDALAAPKSIYGKTKLDGEQAIVRSGCQYLIFRTSWVYSAHGHNFLKTMLTLGQEKESLSVVSDQIGTPTSAELIADVTALALLACREGRLGSGVYHLTASGETSWHGFAAYIFQQAQALGYPLKLDLEQLAAITTAEYPTPASRPANSRLSCKTLEDGLSIHMPDWRAHACRSVEQFVKTQIKQ